MRRLEVAGDDAGRVEQLRQLEELKRAASAAQVRVAAELVASQRAEQVAAGVPNVRAHRGVAEQVALARGESPHRGSTFVGMATALVHEMPCTMAALSEGRITEWAATCLVRETAVLQVHDRAEVDARLERMLNQAGTSQGTLVRAAKGLAQKLDPQSAVARAAKAEADRTVTIRPAPDTMVYVSALLPVAEGVACFAALRQDAARAAATGDPRSRGQVMADAFAARVTGRDPADRARGGARRPGDDRHHPARPRPHPGHGPRPRSGPRPDPRPGRPPARCPRRCRRAGLAAAALHHPRPHSPGRDGLPRPPLPRAAWPAWSELSDQSCRTPWCDAPIAETDHVEDHADDGPTARDNAQGLCRRCNLAKQAPGWSAERDPDGTIRTTTPTGHTYTSAPPPVLGFPPTGADHEPVVQLNHTMLAWHRRTA